LRSDIQSGIQYARGDICRADARIADLAGPVKNNKAGVPTAA
jgi:hypothetical protein